MFNDVNFRPAVRNTVTKFDKNYLSYIIILQFELNEYL